MGTLLGLPQQMSPQAPRFGTHSATLAPSGAERLAKEALQTAIRKADENPTLKNAAVATTVTAGTTLLLWSQPTARTAIRNLAGKLWQKGSTAASALLNKRANQAITRSSSSSPPSSQAMSAVKNQGKNLITHAAPLTGSRPVSNAVMVRETSAQAIRTPQTSPKATENLPITWRDRVSNLRNKLPSKKTVATGAMILGGTAATVMLGRFALSRAGYKVRLPFLDPLVERAQTWGGKLQEAFINKLEVLENWLRSFEKKAPVEDTTGRRCYGDKSTDGCYFGEEIPTGLPESDCENGRIGYYLGREAQTFLGQREEALVETCKRMDEGLKAIGFKKPINNINPQEDLPVIKKLYREWARKAHTDKGGTDEQFTRVSDNAKNFIEFFENKHGTNSDWKWTKGDNKAPRSVLVERTTEQSPAEKKVTAEERAEDFLSRQEWDLEEYVERWKQETYAQKGRFKLDDYMNKFPEDSPYIRKRNPNV